jgi:rhodanese-related sulfurtransferase
MIAISTLGGPFWGLCCTAVPSVNDLLAEARTHLERVEPAEADSAMREGALLIDIRAESQRAADGEVPGAVFVPRNVLEWRLDPESADKNPELAKPDARIVLMCNEGYQSSLAAATLQELGLPHATDLTGGFQAWRAAGLPVIKP